MPRNYFLVQTKMFLWAKSSNNFPISKNISSFFVCILLREVTLRINSHSRTSKKKNHHETNSNKLQPELDPIFKWWARAMRPFTFYNHFYYILMTKTASVQVSDE